MSVVEPMLSTLKALGSIPSIKKRKKMKIFIHDTVHSAEVLLKANRPLDLIL
jgi:hypothetical protein